MIIENTGRGGCGVIDIVKIKQAVKDGELKIYVRDLKVYLQNDIGEVVEIGELEPHKQEGDNEKR